jgi:hypothetical protein
MSDMGAMEPGRWHTTHERFKIGAISFEKVGTLAVGVADA